MILISVPPHSHTDCLAYVNICIDLIKWLAFHVIFKKGSLIVLEDKENSIDISGDFSRVEAPCINYFGVGETPTPWHKH